MLTLSLEPTDDRANPAFKNAASCKKWLGQLQFTNLSITQSSLRTQLDELNRYPMRGLERMQTLEFMRETVHEVQAEFAKKLASKPLPLSENELLMLAGTIGLWQAMATGYQRCLLAYEAGDRQLRSNGALLCHRCLMYSGRQIFEYLRTGYEMDSEQWRQFHAVYLYAEVEGLLTKEVEDNFSPHGHLTSCRFVYLQTLLACQARPQELTAKQQLMLDHWLLHWIANITIDHTCTVSRGDAPPLAIDLAGRQGLQPFHEELLASNNVRYLAMVPISKLIRVKTILLQQGQTPEQLELGKEYGSFDCIELLTHLHKHWCEPRPSRMAERQSSDQEMQLRYGLEDIYSWIAKQPFNPMKRGTDTPQENWRAEDFSLLGARLVRINTSGARLGMNQIVGIRSGDTYRAGKTVWVSVMRTGQLHTGIRFLPGVPQAATAKAVAVPGEPSPSPMPALLLSAVPSLNIPPSLILPRILYRPERVIEITPSNGEKMRLKLKFSVERGTDFERVSFLPA